MPLWLALAGWFVVLIALGHRRGTLRGSDATPRVVIAFLLMGAGVVVALVGLLLDSEVCLGSGSECEGVEPLWSPGGAVVMYAVLAIAFFAPMVPLLRRGRSGFGATGRRP